MIESQRLISAKRVAEHLGVTERRVRMIPATELPYVQLEARGKRAYATHDVAEYLERRTVRR